MFQIQLIQLLRYKEHLNEYGLIVSLNYVLSLIILFGITSLLFWFVIYVINKYMININTKLPQNENGSKSSTLRISDDYLFDILDSADKVCIQQKLYLNPRLQISDLADKIGCPIHILSYSLNNGLAKNFNDFINEYRVQEFINRITIDGNKLTILGVAYECGFNSKTSFYRVFNKVMGTSPQVYLQEVSKGVGC